MIWHEWSPSECPHVVGAYTDGTDDDEHDPPRWKATCNECGATWGPVPCPRRKPFDRIRAFSLQHGHGKMRPRIMTTFGRRRP